MDPYDWYCGHIYDVEQVLLINSKNPIIGKSWGNLWLLGFDVMTATLYNLQVC